MHGNNKTLPRCSSSLVAYGDATTKDNTNRKGIFCLGHSCSAKAETGYIKIDSIDFYRKKPYNVTDIKTENNFIFNQHRCMNYRVFNSLCYKIPVGYTAHMAQKIWSTALAIPVHYKVPALTCRVMLYEAEKHLYTSREGMRRRTPSQK